MKRTIVVGGGQGAGQLVASLRQEGYDGEIMMIGEEPQLPYQRPPLSKAYLLGELPVERLLVRPEKFYADQNIETRLATKVEAIDTVAQTVTLEGGEALAYSDLVLATGSAVRRLSLPGFDQAGVFYLRTMADVDGIRDALTPGKRLVIIGGGYIGLEVAAVSRKLGLEVTVLEMESRILARVTTPAMSAFYTQVHTGHGVVIKTEAAAAELLGDGQVTGVRCKDGTELPADVVIVGVGILPRTELAEAAGIACENGILVDEGTRTSAPNVYAIGDCTNHPNPGLGRRLRLESVPNAMDQARVAAKNICGGDARYDAVPWFWSDQYDLKLQMVGFSGEAEEDVLRGDPNSGAFARFYLKGGQLIAVDAVNSPREFMAARQLVAQKAPVTAEALANPETDLKTLMSR